MGRSIRVDRRALVAHGVRGLRRAVTAGAIGLPLLLGNPVEAAELLVSQVTWRDPAGATGTVLFQGTANGSALTGHVYAGPSRLKVTATLGGEGTVSGTLATTTGEYVSGFTGQVDASRRLVGEVVSDQTLAATFDAPAEQLPLPQQ